MRTVIGVLGEKPVTGKPVSQYEFDQVFAEAKVKFGLEFTAMVLSDAASRFGWPIPPDRRRDTFKILFDTLLDKQIYQSSSPQNSP